MRIAAFSLLFLFCNPSITQAQSLFPIKGEWLEYDANWDMLRSKLVLGADGRGTMTDSYGITDITWKFDAGRVKIAAKFPVLHPEDYSDAETGEYFVAEQGVESLSLKLKGLPGFAVQWEVTASTVVHFPQNPEKPDLRYDTVYPNERLVGMHQLKTPSVSIGDVFSIGLAGYRLDQLDNPTDPELLVRVDAGHVLTVLGGSAIGLDQLFWSLENGALVVADGKGYSARYKIYRNDKIAQLQWVEADRAGVPSVGSAFSIRAQAAVQARGFDQDAAIFKNCWTFAEAEFCFHRDRDFVFTTKYDGQISENHGLWRLEGNKLKVVRYRSEGLPVNDVAGMLNCEATGGCDIFQERSYELLNQDAEHLAVYRHMYSNFYDHHNFHVFTRTSKVPN